MKRMSPTVLKKRNKNESGWKITYFHPIHFLSWHSWRYSGSAIPWCSVCGFYEGWGFLWTIWARTESAGGHEDRKAAGQKELLDDPPVVDTQAGVMEGHSPAQHFCDSFQMLGIHSIVPKPATELTDEFRFVQNVDGLRQPLLHLGLDDARQ